MKLGYFALELKEKKIMPKESALRFARKDRKTVLWHSEGSVKINDIVIYVGASMEKAGIDKFATVRNRDGNRTKGKEVIIFRYGDRDFVPFYKDLRGEQGEDEIDTIYSQQHIHIWLNSQGSDDDCNEIKVKVNGCIYQSAVLGEEGCLLIIKKGLISYFGKPDSTAEDFRAILESESYGGYLSEKGFLPIEEFFDETLCRLVLSANEIGKPIFFNSCGRPAVLMLEDDGGFGGNEKIFSIGDEEGYLENIKKNTKVYDKLYFYNEIEVGNNELGCEARLRGYGENIEQINKKLDKVCRKNVTIVLTGESGTGKTLANEIHKNSRRAEGPFINVNCAAIAYNLIESELFGYEEGAFTGAKKGGKVGYFELAKGGTLFLDEISELPILLQGKLLEVLQENTFYRVGGVKKISADVRLIVATNKDLGKMVKEGRFREDLYYRINVFPIHLPPLRERTGDLYSIVEDALPSICDRLEIEPLMLTDGALEKMKAYNWPGNIRELENVLEKAAVMADENFIREEDIVLDSPAAGSHVLSSLKDKLNAYEKELIQSAFIQFNGNRRLVAQHLGISKTNLFDKVHKYAIEEYLSEEEI